MPTHTNTIPAGWQACPHCKGGGTTPGLSAAKSCRCGVCGGEGMVSDAEAAAFVPRGQAHKPDCPAGLARSGAVGVECPHGFDACPTCDPCTCKGPVAVVAADVAAAFGLTAGPHVRVSEKPKGKGAKHGLI